MEKFIVSARKYRPQKFDTVVGQEHITTTLKNAIKNQQLAHAFLFCGPRGVGKTTCARILAKTINCESRSADGEACNECASCISFNQGTSLNIHELDAASNNSVEDIRELVNQVRFAPQAGEYKVYIIDEVHMLSSAAFNAFLKTLEEPPPYAIFILATTEKHKILPTILSRCQIFDFKRITLQDTVNHLKDIAGKENIEADDTALQLIAQKSEGCMRDSLSILDKIVSFTNGHLTYENTIEHLNILDADYYFKLLDSMLKQDVAGAMLLYDDINKKGFEGDAVLTGFAEFLRNLLICKDERVAELLEVVEAFKTKYAEAAKKTEEAYLVSALNILNESEIHFRAARNKRLHVEMALIKLCYLSQALQLTTNSTGVEKKKITDSSRAVAFKAIQPIAVKPKTTPVKGEKKPATAAAKLTIESEIKEPVAPVIKEKEPAYNLPVNGSKKISSLETIRQQVQHKNGNEKNTHQSLELATLQSAWNQFIQLLKKSKNPSWQSFQQAQLHVVDEHSFEVIVNSNFSEKFIDSERDHVCEFLKKELLNKKLKFHIRVVEGEKEETAGEIHLTAKDQYIKIIQQYPLVKELKDRLKLELNY